jgi:hypothetical protein
VAAPTATVRTSPSRSCLRRNAAGWPCRRQPSRATRCRSNALEFVHLCRAGAHSLRSSAECCAPHHSCQSECSVPEPKTSGANRLPQRRITYNEPMASWRPPRTEPRLSDCAELHSVGLRRRVLKSGIVNLWVGASRQPGEKGDLHGQCVFRHQPANHMTGVIAPVSATPSRPTASGTGKQQSGIPEARNDRPVRRLQTRCSR